MERSELNRIDQFWNRVMRGDEPIAARSELEQTVSQFQASTDVPPVDAIFASRLKEQLTMQTTGLTFENSGAVSVPSRRLTDSQRKEVSRLGWQMPRAITFAFLAATVALVIGLALGPIQQAFNHHGGGGAGGSTIPASFAPGDGTPVAT